MRQRLLLLLLVGLCSTHSLSRAQDAPVWKYIASTINEQTKETTTFHARDCYRFTDKDSEKYPKLAVRSSGMSPLKETVDEYDCQRRLTRTRIRIYTDGKEEKAKELDWMEAVPDSAGEALLNYACRDRTKEKK